MLNGSVGRKEGRAKDVPDIYIYIGVPTLKVWEAVVGDTGDMQPATRNTQHATRNTLQNSLRSQAGDS